MITTKQIQDCIDLLATRRATNGFADLADLRAAAGISHACHTEEEAMVRADSDRDLHEALTARADVAFYRGQYRLMA